MCCRLIALTAGTTNVDVVNIAIKYQPAKSPDMNVLELGLFNLLQSAQYRTPTYKIDALIAEAEKTYCDLSSRTIDKCFLTAQKIPESVIACDTYKLPRVSKHHIRNGVLPTSLPCDPLAKRARRHLIKWRATNSKLVSFILWWTLFYTPCFIYFHLLRDLKFVRL